MLSKSIVRSDLIVLSRSKNLTVIYGNFAISLINCINYILEKLLKLSEYYWKIVGRDSVHTGQIILGE
jgi:hypothetical protein